MSLSRELSDTLTTLERGFVDQASEFLALVHAELSGCRERSPRSTEEPVELQPIEIRDHANLSRGEQAAIIAAMAPPNGVAYFALGPRSLAGENEHPLLTLAHQLRHELNLHFALTHPLESHTAAIARFGTPDGTLKVYDLPLPEGYAGYREVGETSGALGLHHDGLGSGSTVQTVGLLVENVARTGGHTFFRNIVAHAQELAESDRAAFESLFLPDALTITRPRGKGALKVRTPVLFLNELRRPQASFRIASGEYLVEWRTGIPPLLRAQKFLMQGATYGDRGTSFARMDQVGVGCLVQNEWVAHGRTAFADDRLAGLSRVLARKWYMRSADFAAYRHVPGISVDQKYAWYAPQIAAASLLSGEWRLDGDRGTNVKLKA